MAFNQINASLIQELFNNKSFLRNSSFDDRIFKLKNLKKWITQNQDMISEALYKDFKKNSFEVTITETQFVIKEINFLIKNLKTLMNVKKVPQPLELIGHKSSIRYEAKGVVLIIAPWNYPFQLSVSPMIAAIAAGNAVLLKPSELTRHTSNILSKMCDSVFKSNEVLCLEGDKYLISELFKFNLDHVFFTGSTSVGKIIAKLCAEKLIPYTLELGGKSPVIIDETANLIEAAEKIYWGKFLNRGQTCVAPDYAFIHTSIYNQFLEKLRSFESQTNIQDATGFVSEQHSKRLQSFLGETPLIQDKSYHIIETNLAELLNPKSDHQIIHEEIFGPLLLVTEYNHTEDIFKVIQKNPNPLALYIFSKNQKLINHYLSEIPSGGAAINTIMVHLANPYLPFGGLKTSGQGSYHGEFGFKEFSHQRSVIEHTFFKFLFKLLLPPYTSFKKKLARWI